MDVKQLSDEQLIELIIKKNTNVFLSEIYTRYQAKVYAKCYNMTRSKIVSSDLTQDIFLRVIEKIQAFQSKSKFSTWLYSITYNYCIDYLRANKRLKFDDWSKDLDIPDEVEESDMENIFALRQERLDLLLELLKPEDKALLIMKYKEQMSYRTILSILKGNSEDQMKMQVNRAKKRLLAFYNQFYSSIEE